MKIIWHFKNQSISEAEIKEIEEKIKMFYKNSLVVFAEDLEIHIINENEKQDENN